MKLNFQQEVLNLPGAVLSHSTEADATQLRVLLWLASDLSLAQKPTQLAKLADCDRAAAEAAIAFWLGRGILQDPAAALPVMASVTPEGTEGRRRSTKKTETRETGGSRRLLRRADELPTYTTTELSDLLEKRAGVRAVVNEAQQILGKIFNTSEINILVGMLDYLGMGEECVLLLLTHCRRIGKTNLRAIEKYAYTLVDRDITDAAALEEEIRIAEELHSFEGEVRRMFGMKSRALTGKEGKMLRAWVTYGYDIEVVRRAYEKTVSATNEPSVLYANAIIERWHGEGLRTAEEIDAAEASSQAQKEPTTLGNSFDTDDFFEAALKRSFGDDAT